ncbi:MAG: hypothetical protein QM820_04505 [Minicystis sp.]
MPGPPPGWDGPDLLWHGPELQAPECPASAAGFYYQGHAGLDAPNVCGACQCDPPTGVCALPGTMTASSATCPGDAPGAVKTPFDPPVGWDGTCTNTDAADAAALCGGGTCAPSLAIASLTLLEAGCKPTQLPVPKNGSAVWKTYAKVCQSFAPGTCADTAETCGPVAEPGFHRCISHDGDVACPALGPYHERHVFYQGFTDTRACSPCSCGAPEGSTCKAQLSIFEDAACATMPSFVFTLDAETAPCHPLNVGAALSSKSATEPAYTPGTCTPSGGVPMGSAEPADPMTYCCIPSE